MAAPDPETGIVLKWAGVVFGAIGTAAAAVVGGMFKRIIKQHDDEIASIKRGIARVDEKLDTKVDRDVWEQNRIENRDGIIALHAKVEQMGRDSEIRHRELVNIILSTTKK